MSLPHDMTLKESILQAARADSIPAGESFPWAVKKFSISKPLEIERQNHRRLLLPPATYTQLWVYTELHPPDNPRTPWGDCVMHDTPEELNKHLQFMLAAHGRVLITGLGLGCVVRGCLANPRVSHVVVIERDVHVLKLVGRHMGQQPRLTIIHADAIEWVKKCPRKFDCAWHDLWTDESRGEPHLQIQHSKLLGEMMEHVRFQGAWEFPRYQRRLWKFAKVI